MNADRFPDEGYPRDDEWREALGSLGDSSAEDLPDPAFRAAILARTRGAVRGRRRRAGLMRAAAAILIFATGWGLGARSSPVEPAPEPAAGVPVAPRAAPTAAPAPLPGREAIERALAKSQPAERRDALRRAGDDFLGGARVDPSAALLCYQELLADRPGGESLEIATGDSWLLKALKVARR